MKNLRLNKNINYSFVKISSFSTRIDPYVYSENINPTKEQFQGMSDKEITRKLVKHNYSQSTIQDRIVDKRLFLLTLWYHENPDTEIENYSEFSVILNISSKVQRWYSEKSSIYADHCVAPEYIQSNDESLLHWLNKDKKYFDNYENITYECIRRRQEAETEYKNKLLEIAKDEADSKERIYNNSVAVMIHNISIQSLPLSITEKYANMSPQLRKINLRRELKELKSELYLKYVKGEIDLVSLRDLLK